MIQLLILCVAAIVAGIVLGGQVRQHRIVDARMAELTAAAAVLADLAGEMRSAAQRAEAYNSAVLSLLSRLESGAALVAVDRAKVAGALVLAQAAVDAVATDLADSHDRADQTEGQPGEASDAASRSGTPGAER